MKEIRKRVKSNFEEKKKYHNHVIGSLQKEYKLIGSKLDALWDICIEGGITTEKYDKERHHSSKGR
jgi:RNAse (barnase) inhibitor barstar